ncbi:MAG: RNA polymerase sigma factor [Alphaproteobacteria bacterium]|nr:RNA polymerase sigma factor [Alphaproteobacteria bacterium]
MDRTLDSTPRAPHDEDAIKRVAALDKQAAMAMVVRQHRPRLLRHASGILKDPDLAGDVCQEVFIKAMHEPRFFDADFRMGAWLYRVTSNLCLNMVRDHRRRGDILADMPTPRSAAPEQVDAVLDEERHDQVQTALAALSDHHRRILQERFYQDLSYNEIADVLDIKLGTVMSRLSRAKSALLQVLDGTPLAEL